MDVTYKKEHKEGVEEEGTDRERGKRWRRGEDGEKVTERGGRRRWRGLD